MNSSGVGTASSPILIDDDSDTEVEAQVLPVPHPQPQPQLEVSSVPTRPRGPTTPRAPRAIREKDKITSDTVGFQMLMRMGYEPGKGLGLELEGPSEPLQPQHRPVFNKLGLGGVPNKISQEKLTPAPEPEQGTSIAKPLTKKQRKLAAQVERLAQARSQPQAGPSKPKANKPPQPNKGQHNVPNQNAMQMAEDDATYFMQPQGFFPNAQAAMQMQMAQMGMGMPFFPPVFDPMLGFPMDPAFLAAQQGMAFNPDFFPNQFNPHMPQSPVIPTEPRAARNRSKTTSSQKPPSPPKATSSTQSGTEPAVTSDKGNEYTIRGISYRPGFGPIGVQAIPQTNYASRPGGVPGSFQVYPELNIVVDPNRTIVLETMPRKLRTLQFVESWVAQFAGAGPQGEPPAQASRILLRDTKALVEFSTEAGAARAFASPRMNGQGGQPGIRAYAYVHPGAKPHDPPFVQLAISSPQWRDVVTPRDVLPREPAAMRPGTKLFGPEDKDVSKQLAEMRAEKAKKTEVPKAQVNDDLEEGEVIETAQPHASSSSSTTSTPAKDQIQRSAHKKSDNGPSVGQTMDSPAGAASGANLDPTPLSAVSVQQDSTAYEAALRSRIKTRALKRTRDEAFGLQPPPSPAISSLQPPQHTPVLQVSGEPTTHASSTASSSRSTSTPALTPTSATFTAPYVPSPPSISAADPASTLLPSNLITLDAEAFLMDTLRDAKRQRVCPEEPRAAFAFHCARRDALLNEFNAVMAKQASAADRESKRALNLHLKEIMTDLEATSKAVNETKALVDALNATPTPPSPVAQRRPSPPNRISMSPQPAYNLADIVGDVLPTLTPGCVFPNPADDSLFIFTWEEEDDVMTDGEDA